MHLPHATCHLLLLVHLAVPRLTAIRETFEESGVLLLQGSPTLHPGVAALNAANPPLFL